jgi:hypothetical protein
MSAHRIELWSQADTVYHVDHMAVFRQTIDQRGGQMVVFQKRRPLGEAKV